MPFKTFNNWLFDGDIKSKIPEDLLKYNSPITPLYVISLFPLVGKFNYFIDQYYNNINLWYLEKDELFKFIKRAVIDFKIKRNQIPFIPFKKKDKLFSAVRPKVPELKPYEVSLLCEFINSSENKDRIYQTLGLEKLEKPKKNKKSVKKIKEEFEKKEVSNKISLGDLLENFVIISN